MPKSKSTISQHFSKHGQLLMRGIMKKYMKRRINNAQKKICDDSRFKSYITNLLAAEDNEAVSFKNNLAKLHEALNSSPIKSQEYLGVKQDISFSKVLTKNKNSDHHFEYRSIKYKCSKSHGKLTTVVLNTKSGVELLRYEQDEWDIDAL